MYKNSFLLLLAAACVVPAAAQGIYRCGDSYSQQPCPGGSVVEAQDERSAVQRSQTSLAAERDAKTADAMGKARLKEEAKPVSAYIPAKVESFPEAPDDIGNPPVASKAKKPAYFTAVAPRKPGDTNKKKAKKKATMRHAGLDPASTTVSMQKWMPGHSPA